MPTTKHISFIGHNQHMLAGRLELPDAAPRCFAVFTHCFTCSKDILAAYRISKQLARNGIATLRFDFAGLGESEGDFADTNFSTCKLDLIAAADYLRREYQAPQLLIGHSLGGTTALACAEEIAEVKAIVTIAAPSEPEHVLHHFGSALQQLAAGKTSSIVVAGRSYSIKPQFIDDIKQHDMKTVLAQLRKSVLIFSVEDDDIVDSSNADEIQEWIAGESVILRLRNTDHVLSDKESISAVVKRITEWFDTYISRT